MNMPTTPVPMAVSRSLAETTDAPQRAVADRLHEQDGKKPERTAIAPTFLQIYADTGKVEQVV